METRDICGHNDGQCKRQRGHAGFHACFTGRTETAGQVEAKATMWDDAGNKINPEFSDTAYTGHIDGA